MTSRWQQARDRYSYAVDLRDFHDADQYPGYFSSVITSENRTILEERFRRAVDTGDLVPEENTTQPWVIAGEICYMRMYQLDRGRNRLVRSVLNHLSAGNNWSEFTESLRELAQEPSYERYLRLRIATGQLFGFIIPLTFLAFYEPSRYPCISIHTALWWTEHRNMMGFEDAEGFSQDKSGNIQTTTESLNRRNWYAFEDWATFCRTYATRLSQATARNWQVSDVEAAVEVSSRQDMELDVI